jgi:predicted transcriptional regulator
MKIADLEVSDDDKKILAILSNPKTIPEICAKVNLSYSTISQKLSVLKERGLVSRQKSMANRSFFQLSSEVEL